MVSPGCDMRFTKYAFSGLRLADGLRIPLTSRLGITTREERSAPERNQVAVRSLPAFPSAAWHGAGSLRIRQIRSGAADARFAHHHAAVFEHCFKRNVGGRGGENTPGDVQNLAGTSSPPPENRGDIGEGR